MSRIITVLLFLLSTLNIFAQKDLVVVYGTVKDERSGIKLSDVKVVLVEDGKVTNTYVTTLNGKFELDLAFEHSYDIRFTKDGYVTKFVNIDTRNVPKDNKVGGFGFDLDMSLFQMVEGVNFDILKQPIGIAKYSPATGDVAFDYEYTKSIQAKIAELRRALEKKYQEEENKLQKEQQLAEEEKLKQQKFEQLVKEGDEQFTAANYTNAIFKYSDALDLKPATKFVEDKLAAAKKAMEEQNLAKLREQQYKDAISRADKAFTEKQYQPALTAYNDALKLKPAEAYPKEKIAATQKILDDMATQAALDKKYKAEISRADSTLKLNKFEQAITFYESASALKPLEEYPKSKISEARQKLAEQNKQKETDDEYKRLLALGDAAFKAGSFEEALKAYQQSASTKPAEALPKQKIAETQLKLDNISKQKALDEQYKNFLAKADADLTAGQYQTAIDVYKQASALKPAEAYPKTKITEAQGKLAEIAKKEAQDKQYQDLITKGDQANGAGQLQEALLAFQQAGTIKPAEQYPKDKATEIKAKLDNLAKQKALDDQYKALIVKADQAFTAKQYTGAITAYQQASGIKPSETYPGEKIKEAQGLLDELARQKSLDENFKSLVLKGDSAFKAARYEDAIAHYNNALEVKPAEAYPKTKIAEANTRIDALAKQKQLDEQYKVTLGRADEAFKNEAWENAVSIYREASALKPAEAYPKSKITEAQAKIAQLQKQKAQDEQYNKLLASADSNFTASIYQASISKYQQALTLKPSEQYPKDRISEAKNKLDEIAKKKALDDQYKAALAKADAAFTGSKFSDAVTLYNQALTLKPDEVYPRQKIDEANAKLAELEKDRLAREEAYKAAVARGDESFNAADYTGAKASYNEALRIKANEAYPKQKITEADARLAEISKKDALEKQYNDFISRADAAFTGQQYQVSLQNYQQAAGLKPGEQYPKDRIAEINGLLDEQAKIKALEDQYKAAVAKGDAELKALRYETALTAFQQASGLKPAEQYPKDKISEIQDKLDELAAAKATDQKYRELVVKGDGEFTSKRYEEAIKFYEEALAVKAAETYPQERIRLARTELDKIAKAKGLDEQYKSLIGKGDAAMTATEWTGAISAYKEALTVKPAEQYPKDKIREAEGKLAEIEKQRLAKESKYNGFISKGDSAFNKGLFLVSKNFYSEALNVKPAEQYPKDKIAEADARLDEIARQEAEKKAAEALNNLNKPVEEEKKDPTIVSFKDITYLGEVKKDTVAAPQKPAQQELPKPKVMYRTTPDGDLDEFRRKLGENYPDGKTFEKFIEGNKDIFRTIYVQDKLGDEYLKVVAKFGTFYFKNGNGIGPADFEKELSNMK